MVRLELARRFGAVDSFVDAAALLCEHARGSLGLALTCVFLQAVSGTVVLAIDNSFMFSDELRLFMVTREGWDEVPVLQQLRDGLALIGTETDDLVAFHVFGRGDGYTGPDLHVLSLPIVGPRGWLGTVMFGHTAPFTRELERSSVMLATLLATWCAHHGIAAVPEIAGLQLGNRRIHAAKLAARGLTNSEIADQLAISTNTVKAHLKHVYERLGARSRLELVELLRSLAPLDEVPPGITRRPTVTITRSVVSGSRAPGKEDVR